VAIRLILAPLHGITNRVFREAYFKRFSGFDEAMAPFILSARSCGAKGAHFKELLPGYSGRAPLVPQLLSNDAEGFLATARALAELGYREVNWNLGCPYPMVTGKGRGSGLLPRPDIIAAFLDEVCAASPLPLSIKLRLGLREAGELLALMPLFEPYPLVRIIVHPRVASQLYTGVVDLDGLEAAIRLTKHRLAYSGDITKLETLAGLQKRFPGIEEWMIGRGALADPFLPARLKGLPESERPMETLEAYLDDVYEGYSDTLAGPRHVLDKMKELWGYLGPSYPERLRLVKDIQGAKSVDAYRRAVGAFFRA
jgi:tRNA-dihydrouridine synthase